MELAGLNKVDLSGGMGGLFAGINNRQVEDNNNLMNIFQAMRAQQQGLESDRYGRETPDYLRKVGGEADVAQYKGALADLMRRSSGFMEAIMGGEKGEAQTKAAKGELDTALLPTAKERGIAANKEDVDIMGAGKMLRDLNDAFIASQQVGPAGEAAFRAAVEKMPDNNLKQMFLTATPQQRAALFPKIEQMLRQKMLTSEKAQTSLAGIEATGDWHIKVTQIQERMRMAIESMKEGKADDRALLGVIRANQSDISGMMSSIKPTIQALEDRRTSRSAMMDDFRAKALSENLTPGSKEYEVRAAQRGPGSWYEQRNREIDTEQARQRAMADILRKKQSLLQQAAVERNRTKKEALLRDAFAVGDEETKASTGGAGAPTIKYDAQGNRVK